LTSKPGEAEIWKMKTNKGELDKELEKLLDREAKDLEDRCPKYRNKVRDRRTNSARFGEQSTRRVKQTDSSGLQDLDICTQARPGRVQGTEDDIVYVYNLSAILIQI
jgi:hypothetical protein